MKARLGTSRFPPNEGRLAAMFFPMGIEIGNRFYAGFPRLSRGFAPSFALLVGYGPASRLHRGHSISIQFD
jgi:hypothetical protein